MHYKPMPQASHGDKMRILPARSRGTRCRTLRTRQIPSSQNRVNHCHARAPTAGKS